MVTRRDRESLKELLATHVRLERSRRDWTQEDLAEAASLHRTQVGAIERGEKDIRLSTLEKLSVALSLAPDELLRPKLKQQD